MPATITPLQKPKQASRNLTQEIERDNSNTRHHFARMTRKTKVVSKSEDMIHASLKLRCALNVPAIFDMNTRVSTMDGESTPEMKLGMACVKCR